MVCEQYIFIAIFADALHQKNRTIVTNESKIAKLQAKVEELKASAAKKDTLIANYAAAVKDCEGK